MDIQKPKGTWVQGERKAHEEWDQLIKKYPAAGRLMHRLVAMMDRRGAVVVSQKVLGDIMDLHRNTVGKAVKVLENGNWIETVQLGGEKGGVKAYIVNSRVAWADKRENQRFAMFSAKIIASADEQREENLLDKPPLHQLPQPEETQIPFGVGLEPPAQPSLEGLEPDLPAVGGEPETPDLDDEYGALMARMREALSMGLTPEDALKVAEMKQIKHD